eukprot:gnl/Dysnectes_brevis/365_a407_3203.p2 GENE.gnl/Dysnectes_brevis/365_a407_3203~~gnl/Dysnectes_brevis/365_a407_3203.p2  ORF type:complete len:140 (+),score=67.67 gnl/Dysnectes_brevis/365_a407_3203:743-1162(+)
MPPKKTTRKSTRAKKVKADPKPKVVKADGESEKTKKRKKKRVETYASYIYRVLRQVHPEECGISTKGMDVMNSLVIDLFERIANEASLLTKVAKRSTIGSKEIESACRLVFPGELCRHAMTEGDKAVNKFHGFDEEVEE